MSRHLIDPYDNLNGRRILASLVILNMLGAASLGATIATQQWAHLSIPIALLHITIGIRWLQNRKRREWGKEAWRMAERVTDPLHALNVYGVFARLEPGERETILTWLKQNNPTSSNDIPPDAPSAVRSFSRILRTPTRGDR